MSFVEQYLQGLVLEAEIDRFVEACHEGRAGADEELHEYLVWVGKSTEFGRPPHRYSRRARR